MFGTAILREAAASCEIKLLRRLSLCRDVFVARPFLSAAAPSSEMQFDTVVYEVYITDQAGNESNVITTDPVLIRCGS